MLQLAEQGNTGLSGTGATPSHDRSRGVRDHCVTIPVRRSQRNERTTWRHQSPMRPSESPWVRSGRAKLERQMEQDWPRSAGHPNDEAGSTRESGFRKMSSASKAGATKASTWCAELLDNAHALARSKTIERLRRAPCARRHPAGRGLRVGRVLGSAPKRGLVGFHGLSASLPAWKCCVTGRRRLADRKRPCGR